MGVRLGGSVWWGGWVRVVHERRIKVFVKIQKRNWGGVGVGGGGGGGEGGSLGRGVGLVGRVRVDVNEELKFL